MWNYRPLCDIKRCSTETDGLTVEIPAILGGRVQLVRLRVCQAHFDLYVEGEIDTSVIEQMDSSTLRSA